MFVDNMGDASWNAYISTCVIVHACMLNDWHGASTRRTTWTDKHTKQVNTAWSGIKHVTWECFIHLTFCPPFSCFLLWTEGIARWKHTCTKFRAWQLTQFKRVVFMDSDMLVISSIDHALYDFSNASFAAGMITITMINVVIPFL